MRKLWERLRKKLFPASKRGASSNGKDSAEVWAALLPSLIKTSAAISFRKSEAPLEKTRSKFGGTPYLPKDFVWPIYEGKPSENISKAPLAFLAQINLEELAPFDKEGLLPKKGMLYFFYDARMVCRGFDPVDKNCAKVYFFDGEKEDLIPAFPSLPLPEQAFEEFEISFSEKRSLPAFEEFSSFYFDGECDFEDYDARCEKLGVAEAEDGETGSSKLLGYADLIQGEMLDDCERISRGVYCGGALRESEEERKDILKHSRDWLLLLQLGTIETDGADVMWGDCGKLYFYIKKQDLAERNFDGAWVILQCC